MISHVCLESDKGYRIKKEIYIDKINYSALVRTDKVKNKWKAFKTKLLTADAAKHECMKHWRDKNESKPGITGKTQTRPSYPA